ncbi:3-isopropylmalate dehydratase large subunit [Ramlibacter alkalitolerans]|uniref:3-isopropylmalate dehydratase n=1 Tax=Ramlibacter alkalitolerans TaxID=2039631 RepID=A0ABS1JL83_9BURK|nr:3-isopropylmalate dehydratase large subunit [Ramlibacter alkalitolerans]MBL0424987.1 3-isopropylmalate dehydratase large subunit [Ramlibacter alkalitolerans]
MTTLFDKIWAAHAVARNEAGDDLVYIDRHLVQEVSSPQAFASMKASGHGLRSSARHIAVQDHNVPTSADRLVNIPNAESAEQIATLRRNTQATGMRLLDLDDPLQGIVHVIAPELGFVLPGSTVVCGDSHSATLGAMGALAWGIGTSEVAHVMSTQGLWMRKPRTLGIEVSGALGPGVYAKDLALALIHHIGTSGGVGHGIEYFGPAVAALSMEARLTLCNMTIEAGSRFGLVAPDATTLAYLRERVQGPAREHFERAAQAWATLRTDAATDFDRLVRFDAATVTPRVTWGTTPADSAAFSGRVGDGTTPADAAERSRIEKSLAYMGLQPGQALSSVPIDVAFIGSCTNGRLEDLRAAAAVARGRRVAAGVRALVVPGSGSVKRAAEAEGLAQVFVDAGFEWREPGCSMCIGMNGDSLAPGQRCASTSNRNFENRQGQGGRTHLMSPAAAAASALRGTLTDPREFLS